MRLGPGIAESLEVAFIDELVANAHPAVGRRIAELQERVRELEHDLAVAADQIDEQRGELSELTERDCYCYY